MQISIWVPYDEKRLRRTLQYLLRAQINAYRIVGAVLVLLGLFAFSQEGSPAIVFGFVAIGLFAGIAFGPYTVAKTLRSQPEISRDGHHLTLDDEWLSTVHPLAESRLRWAGFSRIFETPDVWCVMFGKLQAITVPKAVMTEEQRATFGAFVNRLQPVGK